MYSFKRRVGNQNNWVWHEVHLQEDADKKGIKYVEWRKCDVGKWGLTDDGFVAKCTDVKKYKKATGKFFRFSFGDVFDYKTTKLNFLPYWDKQCFGGLKPRTWIEKELKQPRAQAMIQAYVQGVLEGKDLSSNELSLHYRKDGLDHRWAIKKIKKSKEWKGMIKKEVREAFADKDFSEKDALEVVFNAIEIAKNKSDPSNMLRGAENLISLLDMKPPKQAITKSIEMNQLSAIEGQIEKEEKKLKLVEKIEGDSVEYSDAEEEVTEAV